jgi:hypothetical protein
MQPKIEEAPQARTGRDLSNPLNRRQLASNPNDKSKQVNLCCEACSRSFVKNSGRRKRFCSDACRKAAQRAKEAQNGFQVGCSAASGNALDRPYNSKGCRAKIENPYPSRFSVPRDLLGRGYCWPGAAEIEPRLRANILWCEGCAP